MQIFQGGGDGEGEGGKLEREGGKLEREGDLWFRTRIQCRNCAQRYRVDANFPFNLHSKVGFTFMIFAFLKG